MSASTELRLWISVRELPRGVARFYLRARRQARRSGERFSLDSAARPQELAELLSLAAGGRAGGGGGGRGGGGRGGGPAPGGPPRGRPAGGVPVHRLAARARARGGGLPCVAGRARGGRAGGLPRIRPFGLPGGGPGGVR